MERELRVRARANRPANHHAARDATTACDLTRATRALSRTPARRKFRRCSRSFGRECLSRQRRRRGAVQPVPHLPDGARRDARALPPRARVLRAVLAPIPRRSHRRAQLPRDPLPRLAGVRSRHAAGGSERAAAVAARAVRRDGRGREGGARPADALVRTPGLRRDLQPADRRAALLVPHGSDWPPWLCGKRGGTRRGARGVRVFGADTAARMHRRRVRRSRPPPRPMARPQAVGPVQALRLPRLWR